MQQSIVIDDDDGQEPETSASSPSSPTAPESPQAPNNSSAAKVSAKEYYETFFVNPVCKTECAKGQARSWKKYSATCKLCAESDAKRLVNGGADSFDAFKKHVTRHHSKTKDYTEFIAKKVKDNEISQTKLSKEQPTLTEFVIQKVEPYGKNHWKQVRLNDAVGNIMLKTLAPPSMLGDLSFDEAIKIGDSKLKWPRRHQLTRHILPKFEKEIRGKIQILLSTATAVSLNVDLWTSKRCHGYMGVTVSFIDEKFCLRNFVLGCPRFKESHTAENIFQLATVLILDYNLKDVLHYVGLDNGRNFVNAFDDWMPSLFPAEFLRKPDAEDEHVVDEDGLNDCVESVENDDERAEESDLDFDSQRTEQAFQKIRDTYCRIPDRNIVVRCAAHTLSLAIGSAMADAQVINQVIDGLAGIVNRVKHSHSETTILEEAFKKTFVSRNQTRWNSNFLMAKRAAEFDWERCGLSQKNILKPAHRLVLQAFVNLMEVFNASFKILQTADYPVIGDVIPILCGLRRHIKTCQRI
ncbi:uncharacterized protein LOC129591407 [Paramacrobiotus metropolitanus]|uniref:uncharacterized protein LOC129591407 n=1 Tax=Paramacrobiotus metropolitanus TaxID=2943436 RepID=UPI0024459928|nr:uncharacterized protein LOC129591407 [Paramacrobiotus metropolitanus]